MAKKMTMYSAAKMLVAVLMITNLTTRCSTTPVGLPAIAEPNSAGNVAATQGAENNEERKITIKLQITKDDAADPKIGIKAMNPIKAKDLEKMKIELDFIEMRFEDQSHLLGELFFGFCLVGAFFLYEKLSICFKCNQEEHTDISVQIPQKMPLYSQFHGNIILVNASELSK